MLEAEAEVRDVTIISKAGERDWRASLSRLERRHPERWRPRAPAEEEGSVLERSLAVAGSGYRLSSLSVSEQEELARLLDRARIATPGIASGPVAALPSADEIWEEQVVRRLQEHPELHRRWVSKSLAAIRAEPDREDEAQDELLDEVAAELGLAPRPIEASGDERCRRSEAVTRSDLVEPPTHVVKT